MGEFDWEKSFDDDSKLVFQLEEASLVEVIRLLTNPNLSERNFVKIFDREGLIEQYKEWSHRWLIFISMMAQKFLKFIATKLACFGNFVETSINLVSLNGGIPTLFFNFLKGKVFWPDRESAKYLSCIGHLDTRVKLHDLIKREDYKYHFALSMMASKASYENTSFIETVVQDHWKMELVGKGLYNCRNEFEPKARTKVMIFLDKHDDGDTYVVAFRGTEPFNAYDWCTDVDFSWYNIPGVGKVHSGFMKALGLNKNVRWRKEISDEHDVSSSSSSHPLAYYVIRDILRKRLSENKNAKFIVTGHSLGGALAILFGTILTFHNENLLLERLKGIYTFGQPRVGDQSYVKYMKRKLKQHSIEYYRFVYSNDVIPRLPFDNQEMMFKHFGKCLYFNRRYQLKVKEEPNKNYYSLRYVIPIVWNAIMEVMRSFTMAYKYGPHFREGWFLFGFRIFGLMIMMPGIPPHGPQDYLNSILLGSFDQNHLNKID